MASVYPQLPPTYPAHAHSNSINGLYDGPNQSVASTPAQTPRPASQQQHVAHGMMPPNSYAAYPDPNMYSQPPAQQPPQHQQPPQYYGNGNEQKPSIYTAVYSNVSVFEMEVNGVAVMRRRNDGWLNATQILKVAGVDKGKRTKVLEKEILPGEHEKVQGGYGKYQGTWISYHRGREFCRQYHVEQLLLPLLEYDISNDGANGQQSIETPTKEQAMAAQRKRMYGPDSRQPNQSQPGTFFKNMSSTAASAINALNRTRVDSPRTVDGRRSVGPRRPSQQQFPQDMSFGQTASQQTLASLQSQESFANNGVLSQNASFADFGTPIDAQEPPRKRLRPTPDQSFSNQYDGVLDVMLAQPGSPTEPSQSFFGQPSQSFMAPQPFYYGLEPLPHPSEPKEEHKKELLLDLFMDPARTDFEDHPAFLSLSGEEFEVPIDGSCNNALHWAATLARIPLVKALIAKGFKIRRTNSGGESALIAACQARNNLDQSTFPQLLELLGSSIEVRDGRGRTMLHHIAVSSAMKGRAAVGKYYLDSLLSYVITQSRVASTSFDANKPSPMTLTRFMSEIVNAQDRSGDTALNLAARTSTKSIIDQLIEVGADPHIGNRGGLAPVDFGVGNPDGVLSRDPAMQPPPFEASQSMSTSQTSIEEAREGLLASLQDILAQSEADFQAELKEKDDVLNKTNAALRESGSKLVEERKELDELQARAHERDELEQKIKNLQRSNQSLRDEISTGAAVQNNITIGEADKGLDLEGSIGKLCQLFPNGPADITGNLSQEQMALLSLLERAEVLSGRVQAYQTHNSTLNSEAHSLRGRSAELEERYKKIVSLCTNTPEERVDDLLDQLVQAVISEQKDMSSSVDLNRVRDFLRLVQNGD